MATEANRQSTDDAPAQPPQRWGKILVEVTTLFLDKADHLSADQIALFDDIFLKLIRAAGTHDLALLSATLSGVPTAPRQACHQLGRHDDILVAGPILRRSRTIADDFLLEIAGDRGPAFLLEICQRQYLGADVADKLAERGDSTVLLKLVQNLGARFSTTGASALVVKAMLDSQLAEALLKRSDVPSSLRKGLAAKVRDDRTQSIRSAPPALQGKIRAAISGPAEAVAAPPLSMESCATAHAKLMELSRKGGLNDRGVNRFAVEHDYVQVAAAISVLSGSSLEVIVPLLDNPELDGLMVACKAARLSWSTTRMIIHHRPNFSAVPTAELDAAQSTFDALSLSVAQRTIHLW
jgi:hypothetical protein